jgi:hypothetical protein
MGFLNKIFGTRRLPHEDECYKFLLMTFAQNFKRDRPFRDLPNEEQKARIERAAEQIRGRSAEAHQLETAMRWTAGLMQEQTGLTSQDAVCLVREVLRKAGWETIPESNLITRPDAAIAVSALAENLQSGFMSKEKAAEQAVELVAKVGSESWERLQSLFFICEDAWIEPLFRAALASPDKHAEFAWCVVDQQKDHFCHFLRTASRKPGGNAVRAIADCLKDSRSAVQEPALLAIRIMKSKPSFGSSVSAEMPQDAPNLFAPVSEWENWIDRNMYDV